MSVNLVTAWRRNDPKLETDVMALWHELNILPPDAKAEERIKEIAVLAYDDDVLIGVSSLEINYFEQMRQKFAFVREFIRPEYRKNQIANALVRHTREMIESYALAHLEEAIAGLAAIFQTPHLGRRAIGLDSGMILVGYTRKHEQVRAGWFEHFTVPENLTPLNQFHQGADGYDNRVSTGLAEV